MRPRNRYITFFGIAAGIALFVIGIIGVQFPPLPQVAGCPENTVPTHHPGECRSLLPMEIDETFPWDKQQAEAKDFFREFQKNVSADRREEVASMMMYPLRVNYYTDPKPSEYRFLQSPAELLDVYDKVFHKSVKHYIANYDATKFGEMTISCKQVLDLRHEIQYDPENLSEPEIDRLAGSLTQAGYFDEVQPKTIDASKSGERYVLNLYCNETIRTDPQAKTPFEELRSDVQRSFPHNPIVFDLVIGTPENRVTRLE